MWESPFSRLFSTGVTDVNCPSQTNCFSERKSLLSILNFLCILIMSLAVIRTHNGIEDKTLGRATVCTGTCSPGRGHPFNTSGWQHLWQNSGIWGALDSVILSVSLLYAYVQRDSYTASSHCTQPHSWELGLIFHHVVGPGGWTQIARLGAGCLCRLSHLTGPLQMIFIRIKGNAAVLNFPLFL